MTEPSEAAALLETLRLCERMRREVDEHEYVVVGRLQELGVSWAVIGRVYGISRQAARDRFIRPRRRERRSAATRGAPGRS
ncbi:MAG TPA: hypothetical protein VHF47_09805 [Acidimicrobiales bacterium]|nr:hypothetical protein [Acidimicrobiales bacterium]